MRIVLASKSPRRREILAGLGLKFDVIVSEAEEKGDLLHPDAYVSHVALEKALAVQALLRERGEWDGNTLILAADTIVWAGGEVLGKPRDAEDAKRMLRLLSDGEHEVISGYSVIYQSQFLSGSCHTKVGFGELTDRDIDWYVASGEPMDKAGAYAVQGLASMWIYGLQGDYFNVVGLPVNAIDGCMKRQLGFSLVDLVEKHPLA